MYRPVPIWIYKSHLGYSVSPRTFGARTCRLIKEAHKRGGPRNTAPPAICESPLSAPFLNSIRTLPLKQKYFSTKCHLRCQIRIDFRSIYSIPVIAINDLPVLHVTAMPSPVVLLWLVEYDTAISSCVINFHAGVTIPFI